MTTHEAARRAATKIRDAMPWSMTDESFEELVAEIAAEFAGMQAEIDRLRGLLGRARKYARGVDLCSDIDAALKGASNG